MISSEDIGYTADSGGVGLNDLRRKPRWFRITAGTNPYTAVEVYVKEYDGSSNTLAGGYSVTAAQKLLWEANGETTVPAGTVVEAVPNDRGSGFVFVSPGVSAEPYPLTDLPCLVVSGGSPVGLSQIVYTPATGEAECKTSGICGCPPSSPPDPETSCCSLWYCTPDGPVEVSADADGIYTPPGDWDGTEPHLTEAEAEAACPTPTPMGGTMVSGCCVGQQLAFTLTLTLSGGFGTVSLAWDGTNWVGSKALTGCTVTFTFSTACGLSYTAPGAASVGATCGGGCVATCGPPFSMGLFRVQSGLLGGSTCSFGNLTGTLSE